jgi:hypothetical protein
MAWAGGRRMLLFGHAIGNVRGLRVGDSTKAGTDPFEESVDFQAQQDGAGGGEAGAAGAAVVQGG